MTRTHHLGELRIDHIGNQVVLSGWVHRRRDHGGIVFVDLRDRKGITQIVFDPKICATTHRKAEGLRSEWVIQVKGKVIARAPGMENRNMITGDIEVEITDLQVLAQAITPPFSICEEELGVSEDLRLKYRYLDIRRGKVAHNLRLRHSAMMAVREFLNREEFTEIATPILCKSTPEGARDYLVPSRVHPGNFYALPQSPQLFKQLLMISGMERYFQIAQCFRDEDLRADRQPEFTQIDIEMSFETTDSLMTLMEGLLYNVFDTCIGIKLETPFKRLSYAECMDRFGSDKPDLRFAMELKSINSIAAESHFSVFKDVVEAGGVVKGLCVKGGADISRKEIDRYTEFVAQFGLKGLAWMKFQDEGLSSSITKFFSADQLTKIVHIFGAEKGDLIFFAAEHTDLVNQALDHLRRLLGQERGLVKKGVYKPLWVVDFPLFERDASTGQLKSVNHPFTAPHPEDLANLEADPTKVRALAYDVIINGYEVGGGSSRIYDSALQAKIFGMLKMGPEEIKERFGFFVEALRFGTPPHLGIAFGADRLTMILAGTDNIRDVIAFPKTQKASDLMMQSPSSVDQAQLRELNLRVDS